jgi:hypothetical protein
MLPGVETGRTVRVVGWVDGVSRSPSGASLNDTRGRKIRPMAYASDQGFGAGAQESVEAMSITRLLQERVFEPEILMVMSAAYERARIALGLTRRNDPATVMLAQTVIEVVEEGVRDPELVFQRTIAARRNA